MTSLVTFFSLFRNERKKSNQKKESAKGYRRGRIFFSCDDINIDIIKK